MAQKSKSKKGESWSDGGQAAMRGQRIADTWLRMPPSTPNGAPTYTQSKPAQITGDIPSWDNGSLDQFLVGSAVPTSGFAAPEPAMLPTEDLSRPEAPRLPTEDLSQPRPPTEDLSLPQFAAAPAAAKPVGDVRALSPVTGAAQKVDVAPLAAALQGGPMPTDMPGSQPVAPEAGTPVAPGTPGSVPVPETAQEADDIKMFMKRRNDAIANEQAGQAPISSEIARLRGDNPLDLRPLAALVDTWTGSNMLPGFDKPRNNGAAIAALQAAIQKSKGNITDSETEMLKNRYMARDTAARDDKKYMTQADVAKQLQDALNARQQALFGQQTGLQQAKFGQQTAMQGRDLASRERRTNTMGSALNNQRQENKVEDRRIAADKVDADRAIAITNSPLTSFYRSQGILGQKLNKYYDSVKKLGLNINPASKETAQLASELNKVILAMKEVERLGALTGQDVPIMKSIIPDVTSFKTNFWHANGMFSTEGKDSALSILDTARNELRTNIDTTMHMLRSAHPTTDAPRASKTLDSLQEGTNKFLGIKPAAATSAKPLHEMTQAEKEAEIRALEGKGAK